MNCATETLLDVDLEVLINRVLVKRIKNNDRDYSHFHPSEFDDCHRKLAYKYYEYKKYISLPETSKSTVSPTLQRIFDNGHYMHARLGDVLEDTGLLKGKWQCSHPECGKVHGSDIKLGVICPEKCDCGHQFFKYREVGFFDEETFFGGHVDAILDLRLDESSDIPSDAPEEDSHVVVDFKSINSFGFKKLIGPTDKHIKQMQIYLFLSGLKVGKFLYENKDDQKFRQFLVERDDNYIDQRTEEAKKLKYVISHTNSEGQPVLPSRPSHYKRNTKECLECKFNSHCWGSK